MSDKQTPHQQSGAWDRADGMFRRLEAVASAIAAAAMFVVMIVVFTDVGMRYGLNSPMSWTYDVVTLYLLSALFFFALAPTWRDGRHIRIDIALRFLPDRARAACDLIGALLALALTIGFLERGIAITWDAWTENRVTPGAYDWPSWASLCLMPLGMALLAARLLFQTARHVAEVRGLRPVPPIAHDELGVE